MRALSKCSTSVLAMCALLSGEPHYSVNSVSISTLDSSKPLNDVTTETDGNLFGDIDQQPLENPELTKQNRTKYVHIIPHSHTDLGWQGTIQDYFQGQNLELYIGSVNSILTTVTEELSKNANRTFSYAEMEFFKMWWDRQNDEQRSKFKNLVKNGQFQIVNGGMSAPDEATTNADDIMDNFMRGHQFLKNQLDIEDPNISWQLDSFGVSKGYARLAKDMGFDAMFFSRIDTDEKIKLQKSKDKVQVWRPDEANFGAKKDVLSIVMAQESGNYCWPKGFAFDQNYNDFIDFEADHKNYNAKHKMDHLKRVVNRMIESEQSDHVFITYGCDFAFTQAQINYFFMDNVIEHWNKENANVKMFYSTPLKYLNELRKDNDHFKNQNIQLFQSMNQNQLNSSLSNNTSSKDPQTLSEQTKSSNKTTSSTSQGFSIRRDDSFPYAQRKNQYWSGFFTSRPQLKKLLRITSSHFHSSLSQSSMQVLKKNNTQNAEFVIQQQKNILEKIGTLQHHDSITGTGVKSVAEDYFVKAANTLKDVQDLNFEILSQQLANQGLMVSKLDQSIMTHKIFSDKLFSPYQLSHHFLVIAQNPSMSQTSQLVTLDCPYNKYSLYQIDLTAKSLQKVEHDNFRMTGLVNGDQNTLSFKNEIQIPVSFANFEQQKVFLVVKEKELKPTQDKDDGQAFEQKLKQADVQKIDKSQSELTNFKEVVPGDFLDYGDKQLFFRGVLLMQTRQLNQRTKGFSDQSAHIEDEREGVCQFELIDKKQNISQRFVIGPRFYQSDESRGNGDGIYEFHPRQNYSEAYSKLQKVEMSSGKFSGQFLLTYDDAGDIRTDGTSGQAQQMGTTNSAKLTTTVELSSLSEFLKFAVTLDAIPISKFSDQHSDESLVQLPKELSGKNVVMNWEFLDDFDTNGELWYDANGLEMVHKDLWKRQEFEMSKTDNIASNFYPIQSAIAVRDKNSQKQVTIMTDRAMAGSAGLRGGRNIELMQNRRIIGYDADGVPQSLDDKDSFNNGLEIKAQYFMQIFDRSKVGPTGASLSRQRQNQLQLEQPILLMYSKDFTLDAGYSIKQSTKDSLIQTKELASQTLKNKELMTNMTGQPDQQTLKQNIYALDKNQILVRISNMEDNFDQNQNVQPRNYKVDLKQLASQYFCLANNQDLCSQPNFTIEETTLTGITNLKQRMLESTEWQTRELLPEALKTWQSQLIAMGDDAQDEIKVQQESAKPAKNQTPETYKIHLEPQRIRAFKVTYFEK